MFLYKKTKWCIFYTLDGAIIYQVLYVFSDDMLQIHLSRASCSIELNQNTTCISKKGCFQRNILR